MTSELPETLSREKFGALHGVKRATVSRWLQKGHAVLADGTNEVAVRRSNELLAARLRRYRGGDAKNASDEVLKTEIEWETIMLREALRRCGEKLIDVKKFVRACNEVLAEWRGDDADQ